MNYKNKMVLERFERNLIELSKSDTWEEASKEWGFLYERKRDNKDNHCLCSYLIKNQNYYYNKNTKKIICCGTGCRKHIDDYIGDKKYDNNFISDLNSIMGNVSVGEYDLEEWCNENKQRLYDRFFWRVDALMTEEQLFKFAEYLDEMWFELVNLDVILDKIDEKLQAISDRKEAEEERVRQQAERVRQQKEAEEERVRQQVERVRQQIEKEQAKELERLRKITTEARVRKEKDIEQLEVYKKELRVKENNYRIKDKELKLMNDEIIKLRYKMSSIKQRLRNKNCCSALFMCDCNN